MSNQYKEISTNKKAYHEYFVLETYECGLVLVGNEVKSLRVNGTSLKESWVTIQGNELVLRGIHIKHFDKSNTYDLLNENREIRLLAHRKEIEKFKEAIKLDGNTIVPLKMYFNDKGKCKIEVAIVKGKHNYDKRQDLKDKQMTRDINRELRERNKCK